MPRRRRIEIKASELACFDTLVEALRSRSEFADFDPASLRVWAYESHEQELKNDSASRPLAVYTRGQKRVAGIRQRAVDEQKGFGCGIGHHPPDALPLVEQQVV